MEGQFHLHKFGLFQQAFYAFSLDKVINGTLGVRSSTYNGYQWDEIISAMSDVFLCGGDCVEDVNRSECHLRESPEIRFPLMIINVQKNKREARV